MTTTAITAVKPPPEILIVEDSPTQIRRLQKILEREGYHVTIATDGQQGLDAARRRKPTLIISDIVMPKMDGYELCRRIKADSSLADIPVFLVTSLSDPQDVIRGLECRADHFLLKPYDDHYLLGRVQYVLLNHEARTRTRTEMGVEIFFNGQRHFITSDRMQILDLLISTYDAAIQRNKELQQAHEDLRKSNATLKEANLRLEKEIREREQAEQALRASEARLRELNESLEGLVAARTKGLRESEQRFQLAVDGADAGLWDWDLRNDEVYLSPRFHELLGYEPAELPTTSSVLRDAIHPADREQTKARRQAHLERGDPYAVDYRFRTKSGEYRWFHARGQALRNEGEPPHRMVGWILDITERKQSEETIREQALLLDKARDAIFVTDLDHRISFWNKSAERLYGWSAAEAVGRQANILLGKDPALFERVQSDLHAKGEWIGEMNHTTKDTRIVQVEARCTLVRSELGRPQAILAINTNITERKNIEAQFLRAQRVESIGTLASGIAHDLNNILAPILMSIGLLRLATRDGGNERILDTIERSAKRGADLVKQVLSFARGIEGHRMPTPPRHLVNDVVHIIAETFPKSLQCESDVAGNVWPIFGDPTQLHQVLLNLCVNARDAMPDGGTLTITAENVTIDEHYVKLNRQGRSGHYVVLKVTDTGSGIPPEIRERIFDPFFTTKPQGKGTGLGLATVMTIVQGHEGFISVYSEVGNGTTFEVHFPADATASAGIAPPAPVDLPRGNGECVLVVDDETSVRAITQQTLAAFGYRVLLAENGVEAIEVFAEHRREIAVVLTDMMMPIMDGPTAIVALKKLDPQVRIIAASGLNADDSVVRATDAGVMHFLPKPYTAETILMKLRDVLDEPASNSRQPRAPSP